MTLEHLKVDVLHNIMIELSLEDLISELLILIAHSVNLFERPAYMRTGPSASGLDTARLVKSVSYKLGSLSHRNWILWLAHIRPLNHGRLKIYGRDHAMLIIE